MILRFSNVKHLDDWLDNNIINVEYHKNRLAIDWARISKMAEEIGEAIQAFIGWTGQNPRKGYSHKKNEVLDEIADAVFTGILAIQHFTKDEQTTIAILQDRWDYRITKWQETIQ